MAPTGANESCGRVPKRCRIGLVADPYSDCSGTIPPRHHEGLTDPAGETETFEFTTPQSDRSRHRTGSADGDTDDGGGARNASGDIDLRNG